MVSIIDIYNQSYNYKSLFIKIYKYTQIFFVINNIVNNAKLMKQYKPIKR